MPKEGFQPEAIIDKLRHTDVLFGQGKGVAEVVKGFGVTEVDYDRWCQECSGMSAA